MTNPNKNMNKDNSELIQKISQTESLIQNTKASLKTWANQIGQYYKSLKELSSQLESLKNQLNLNMNKPNKTNQGGTK